MSPAAEAIRSATERIVYGPWLGSMRSVPPDLVPPEYIASTDQSSLTYADTASHDYLYLPRTGTWKRRLGQTQKFDTFGSSVGLLRAKYSSRCVDLQEFVGSDSLTSDSSPTLIGLAIKDKMASASVLDDGRFSNVYVRDQVYGSNYLLGSEYDTVLTYPAPGSVQSYKVVPLWYDSGNGGITRGAAGTTGAIQEFSQRFFASGSRRMQRVGRHWYFPNFRGTPARWNGERAAGSNSPAMSAAAVDSGSGSWSASAGTLLDCLGDQSTADWANWDGTTNSSVGMTFNNAPSPWSAAPSPLPAVFQVVINIRATAGSATRMLFSMAPAGGGASFFSNKSYGLSGSGATNTITTSFADYTYTLSASEIAAVDWTSDWKVTMINSGLTGAFQVAYVYLLVGDSTSGAITRLIPSGPWPMTHAGTLAKGTNTTSTATYYPESDAADGNWTTELGLLTLSASIDETTADDTDYIQSQAGNESTCQIIMQDFSSVPVAGDTVTIHYRSKRLISGATGVDLVVDVYTGATAIASDEQTQSSGFANYSFTLSDAQIAAVTAVDATWANLRLHFTSNNPDTGERVFVSYADITHRPAGAASGGWKGSDRFYYGVIPIFEDGSYFMPTLGRAPNSLLANGFNLFTVDSSNPGDSFDKVTWSHLPVPPAGFPYLGLARTDKIDSSTEDDLELNPLTLRFVDFVTAGTTTYDDYKADDDALQLDPDNLLVRWDHIMPPRARYAFAGDMRMCHSYGGVNPAAIILAPVGHTEDYDLNVADTSSSAYGASVAMYVRIDHNITTSNVYTLNLVKGNETATETFALTSGGNFDTLQKLVDGINATSIARDGQQWRAQLCPGVLPDTPSTNLLPHARSIASCVVNSTPNGTITIPSGTKVAVGALISGTGVTAGAYVSSINSATSSSHVVSFTGAITAATVDLTFYFDLGDNSDANLANEGYQRVIANSLPGFLYFQKAYLDTFPVEKSSVWMTTASPDSTKSAPNCFSGKLSNKFFPPNESGISMGGVAVDNGFFVPFSRRRGVIRNDRDSGTGLDADYRLFITNENSGCVSFMSVCGGTGFGVCAAPEGIVAGSLRDEMLLSEAIWRASRSEGETGVGDFSYEIPQCIASTAADSEVSTSALAYLVCEIMRGILWVNYRTSSSTTHPNRQVAYDFSSGLEVRGIGALKRSANQAWGWSVPLVRSVSALSEARTGGTTIGTSGTHLYGWNDANAGSTGDGRIDELETAETDNGTAIAAEIDTPWFRFQDDNLSAQEIIVEQTTPSGAVANYLFHRSLSDEAYSLTATTHSQAYYRDRKGLTLPARARTAACYIALTQTSGSAQEIRKVTLLAKRLRADKLNT